MLKWLAGLVVLVAAQSVALAQPFNVRSWYADGQVFVVWEFPAPPALPTDTVEIYASAVAQPDTQFMQLVGRLFFPEYTGGRLGLLAAGATLTVPTPPGGTYTLLPNEGVFVFTPRQNGALFFAVVDTGSTVVVPANSDGTNFLYDPVNDPIRPHPQFAGFTPGGNPYTAYVVWAEGRVDYDNHRPDFPVTASPSKNGVPHVFTITLPNNALPAEPLSCLFAIHGGGGEYHLFRPGIAARANMSLDLDDGIVVTPDDSYYCNVVNVLERSNTSWFGYTPDVDPFDSAVRTVPASTAVVVNYTQRRVHWILDWLLGPSSPHDIDPRRVAMVGHSGGGRGTSHLTRLHPQRFCAAVCYTPASDLSIPPAAGQENFLRGNWDQNLDTNLSLSVGGTLGVTDVFTMTTRLSEAERDFPLTRVFYGKRDEESAAAWTPTQRAVVDSLDDSGMGFMIFWDEREHGVELWDVEANDLFDDPTHTNPWPDVGQWVAPVRTRRSSGQYLVNTYRSGQTYPGFFNADVNPLTTVAEPDIGPGDPDLGEPYGTWGGYFDWNTATLVDEPRRWACTIFTADNTLATIDDCPFVEITTDVAPRRPQAFFPIPGSPVDWTSTDVASGAVLQSGQVIAGTGGVVVVPDLVVPRDPSRIRLVLSVACGSADFDGDGDTGTDADIEAFFACLGGSCCATCGSADFDNDGDTGTDADIEAFFRVLGGGSC